MSPNEIIEEAKRLAAETEGSMCWRMEPLCASRRDFQAMNWIDAAREIGAPISEEPSVLRMTCGQLCDMASRMWPNVSEEEWASRSVDEMEEIVYCEALPA